MDKKIVDYLHSYLPFEFFFFGYKYTVIGFKDCGHFFQFWHEHGFFDVIKSDFKLPLRKLSDMTEEEMDEILRIGEHQHNGTGLKGFIAGWKAFGAETFLYLLSKHFDLFGLIPEGLAVDNFELPKKIKSSLQSK